MERLGVMLAALAAALGAGCELQYQLGETELTHACVGAEGLAFEADGSTRASISVEELDADRLPAAARVRLSSVELVAARGIDDFTFVDQLRLELLAEPVLDNLTLVDQALSAARSPLHLEPSTDADLGAYLREPSLTLDLTLAGEMPAHPWSADVRVCFVFDGAVVE